MTSPTPIALTPEQCAAIDRIEAVHFKGDALHYDGSLKQGRVVLDHAPSVRANPSGVCVLWGVDHDGDWTVSYLDADDAVQLVILKEREPFDPAQVFVRPPMASRPEPQAAPASRARRFYVVDKAIDDETGQIVTAHDARDGLFHEVECAYDGDLGSDVLFSYTNLAMAQAVAYALNNTFGGRS
ncbi:MAG: hypothetical protein WBF53_06390 [Litorimonas sp.]